MSEIVHQQLPPQPQTVLIPIPEIRAKLEAVKQLCKPHPVSHNLRFNELAQAIEKLTETKYGFWGKSKT